MIQKVRSTLWSRMTENENKLQTKTYQFLSAQLYNRIADDKILRTEV